MLVCEICGQQVILEEDMRTHILLTHIENKITCPFCCLSGVSYDELKFHINTAHPESQDQGSADAAETAHILGSVSNYSPTKTVRQAKGQSERCEGAAAAKASIYDTTIEHTSTSLGTTSANIGTAPVVGTRPTPEVSPVMASSQTPCSLTRQPLTKTLDPQSKTSKPLTKIPNPQAKTPILLAKNPDCKWSSHCEVEGEGGTREEHSKAKQKRLASPRKGKQFPCPICSLVCSDCSILQEHVELHLQEPSPEVVTQGAASSSSSPDKESPSSSNRGGGRLECPLCSLVCEDSSSLQEHVDLHLEYNADTAIDTSTDLRLARRLQEEEEQRSQQLANQEADDFKKLQFGLDGGGGYRRQMEKNLERAVSRGQMVPAEFHSKKAQMMESLSSGLDDGRTRTPGLLGALYAWYQREAGDCVQVWLCADTDHFCSSEGDRGWGCGYRNFQMLLSCLNRAEPYATRISDGSNPSIPRVQRMIEAAWREGLDPQGASHFNERLQGTRAWIGATEIYSLLTSLGVRARIIDFHQPSGPGNTHPRLFDWVKQYFSSPTRGGSRLPPRVVKTPQPPIYLQHQGHSRSIVGLEQRRNGTLCVLLLDPGCSPGDVRKLLTRDAGSALTAVRRLRKFPGNLKHQQYQVVAAEGVLSPEEQQTRILNSRTLRAERIP
ncbi:zinc finger-containing ubiquitin peptidase 1 isoform X2 [Osmerus mordax]|uniref:zinc finger-containing ubiquitin peptidase 1 isoform X2 n=1 Tax=Osmerus mordax TaxID=8014 RepID=UPI00350FB640